MINHRTDFFLLGIVVFELMYGHHPFDPLRVGNTKSLVENILDCKCAQFDEQRDETLVGFLESVLRKSPYQRVRTVEALMNQLQMDPESC